MGLCAPVFAFTNCNARSLVATDHKDINKLEDYFHLRMTSSTIAILVSVIATVFYDSSLIYLVGISAIMKFVESISDLQQGLFQKYEALNYAAISLTANAVLMTAIVAGCITYFKNLESVFIGLISVKIIIVFFESFLLKKLNSDFSITNILRHTKINEDVLNLLKISLPLGVAGALVSLNSNIPRYLIDKLVSSDQLGIYIGVSYFLVGAATVTVAVKQAVISRLSRYWHENYNQFKKLLIQLIILSLSVGSLSVFIIQLIGDEILVLLYGEEFNNQKNLMSLMFSAATLMAIYSFTNASLTIIRSLKIQAYISSISIAISIASGYFLVQNYGLIGAGITVNIASAVFALGSTIALISVINKERKKS